MLGDKEILTICCPIIVDEGIIEKSGSLSTLHAHLIERHIRVTSKFI